jgi:hypothetical protein
VFRLPAQARLLTALLAQRPLASAAARRTACPRRDERTSTDMTENDEKATPIMPDADEADKEMGAKRQPGQVPRGAEGW